MKNNHIIGSKTFWVTLTVIFGVFIIVAGVILVSFNSKLQTTPATPSEQTTQITEQQTLDHSFEAIKGRVDSVNDNYGQNVKSSYYGNYSTMEQMMQSRVFFSNLKSTLIIILIVMAILLILVKGFNLQLFKKVPVEGDTADRSKPEGVPAQKPKPVVEKPVTDGTDTEQQIEQETVELPNEKESSKQEDEQDIADSCQLP